MTARRHPRLFERIVLMAPFLGTRGDIARLKSGANSPPKDDAEREMIAIWRWLTDGGDKPPIAVLHGHEDRFRYAYDFLARRVPDVAIRRIEGGHDWRTWKILWDRWLTPR